MFGGRIYTLTWDAATAISVAIDIFEVDPAVDKGVFVHELKIWQTTELGDAAEEIIPIRFVRGFTTSGSVGAAAVVAKKYTGDAAASFVAECRNTTLASVGTPEEVGKDGWNVRVPYIWTPTPVDFVYSPNPILVVRMTAPADVMTMEASMIVEEIG